MKYSKSNYEYFRNKKGGGLETNGILNGRNFIRETNKSKEFFSLKNTNAFELPEMNSSGKYKIKPIKIMVKKKLEVIKTLNFLRLSDDEHYIFFGFDPKTGIYEYVWYVNPDFAGYKLNAGSPIICKKRKEDGTIVELRHEDFLNINIKELSFLFYQLILIYQKNEIKLNEIFRKYLEDYVLPHILKKYKTVNNKILHDIVGKIKEIIPRKNNGNNNNNNNNEISKKTR